MLDLSVLEPSIAMFSTRNIIVDKKTMDSLGNAESGFPWESMVFLSVARSF